MIRPVLGTIATRVCITAMSLLVVMAAGHALGAAGLGTISLVVLGVTFILLLNNVVGGGALVYLAPRYPAGRLMVPGYAWAVLTALVAWMVLQWVPLVPEGLAVHVVGLAFLQSVNAIHLNLLLGRQRIAIHNTLLVLQAAITLVVFVVLLRTGTAEVMDYVIAAYAAHAATVVGSALALFAGNGAPHGASSGSVWPVLFRQGGLVQTANLMQLLNYRLTFYLLERWQGVSAVGLFSVAVQLAESAWLAPKSLGTVLYARVSNTTDVDRQRELTLTILKASLAFSVAVVLVLLVVPDAVMRWAFGEEVHGLTPIIAVMAPGLVAMSASQAFSHFFSGTGRNQHNVVGSALGLVFTVALGLVLIPAYGLLGAAFTATAAYLANGLYQATVFARITATRWAQWVPRRSDLDRLHRLWREARAQ